MRGKSRGSRRLLFPLVVATVLGLVLASCATSSTVRPETRYYVSLGDSYSVGYQPLPTPGATGGFTAVVARGAGLDLVNFGCGGATTTSVLETKGCVVPYGPPAATHGVSYPDQSQAAAAEAFLRRHRGAVGLVTVIIGGNDVTACARSADPIGCVTGLLGELGPHVSTLVDGLRAAVGPKVPIIGLTYPDVILGEWVYPAGKPDQSLATLSVTAFKSLINPELQKAYASAKAAFVDITADTGAYISFSQRTTLAPYGTIPSAVAYVCQLTWYCQLGNIHAKTSGYDLIGKQILNVYRKLSR